MSQFARKLNNLEQLTNRSKESLSEWWNDMLRLWRPSGVDAKDFGLRLAIRNGYLNFYRRGQSIARVTINNQGMPTAGTHFKYVCSDVDKPIGQEYVKLEGDTILRGGKPWRNYGGDQNLKNWIALIDNKYAGDEKKFVDQLVAANPDVIDLEMGLPAWETDPVLGKKKRSAPRMDLVALEDFQIVFWEAKLVNDARIRSSDKVIKDNKPKVLEQLAAYQKFLSANDHAELIATAYQNAAKELVLLRSAADKLGEVHTLGAGILAVGSSSSKLLKAVCKPRLVVLGLPKDAKKLSVDAWAEHAKRLEHENVFFKVIEPCGPFLLGSEA